MSRPSRLGCALATVGVFVGLCGVWSGCNGSGPPVVFVLPDGYTGPVYLIEDERNGTRIPYVDGQYVVEMPTNCQLRVSSLSPLLRWHTETIRYKNGKVIPDRISMSDRDPSAVMLRSSNCGSANGGPTRIEMFIGTDEQYTQYLNGPRPDFK